MITIRKIWIALLCLAMTSYSEGQVYEFKNGYWLREGRFYGEKIFSVNGRFTSKRPQQVDSVIDLHHKYCVPPFGDAHTHNLDGTFNLDKMIKAYMAEGVFYVQVLGNNGERSLLSRDQLKLGGLLDVYFANGLLTSTYGHGFFPYEPLAMGIYAPYLQMRYADSIKKSRIVENKAYYFLDTKEDVDFKWPLIKKYRPDIIKICLNDAAHYAAKRKIEKADDNGLSEEVAAYVVKKAHQEGLRVFAHIETAADARLCAKIGVDGLAHLPGYYWDGRETTKNKYCISKTDVMLFKKTGMIIIPTVNINGTVKYDTAGKPTYYPERFRRVISYKKNILQEMYRQKIPIAIGADYFGKTVQPELDTLIKYYFFSNEKLLDIYSRITPQSIFPGRLIGEIKEGYEASFLVLANNPLKDIRSIKQITMRIKNGKIL